MTNNTIMRKLYFAVLVLLACQTIVAKNGVTFEAYAPETVAVGDQFRLAYTVTTQKIKEFRASPGIPGLDVLMGPSRSQQSSTQIVNGNMTSTSSVTFTYILQATKEGTYSIPAASVNADGEQLISNSVKITVIPADKAAQNSSSGNSGQRSSQQQQSASPSSSGTSVSSEDFFVTATASRTKVVEQEAFLLTYKIYSLVDMQLENLKLPDFKGFHSQEVERPKNTTWKLEHYKGRNYKTAVYLQYVLFPQQAGELTIDPARFDAVILKPVRVDDPFEAFFNGGSNYVEIRKTVNTPKLTIKVDPLPTGKPSGFSGGVGTFNISSSINSTEVKTNDAITVKLVISGTGNLRLVSTPEVEFPSDFEVYDPKVDFQTRLTQEGVTGNKVIEYLAIPRHAGTFNIPSVAFSYYDTKAKAYKTLKTEAYTVNVQKGEGNAEQVISNFTNKEDLKVLGEDIRFIKLNDVKLHPKGEFFFSSVTYWMWYIIPALIFIIFFVMHRKQAIENRNVAKARTKKANKVAVKRLKAAGKLLANNQKNEFYDEVLRALWGYISDKLNIPVSQLSKDNIEEKLTNYGVDQQLIGEFISALNECEFAKFAPGEDNLAMDKVYAAALDVISKMENSIKH